MKTEIKERPILFNGAMVRAILDGRKTQTRRVLDRMTGFKVNGFEASTTPGYAYHFRCQRGLWQDMRYSEVMERCPYGTVGERLWVKEKSRVASHTSGHGAWYSIEYAAGGSGCVHKGELPGKQFPSKSHNIYGSLRWQPSIHMPRWASRINLEITGVRVERLKEISEEDAKAEGVIFGTGKPRECRTCARGAFMDLWESINGAGSWAANPWVWVVEFQKI